MTQQRDRQYQYEAAIALLADLCARVAAERDKRNPDAGAASGSHETNGLFKPHYTTTDIETIERG